MSRLPRRVGLDVKVRRSPYPGVIESASGSLDTLSADRHAGHASGYELVICDETGLFPERSRDLLAGLRSSVSARNGKVRHISIRGDSPLFKEILENPVVVSSVHAAADGCSIDDEAAWRAANPGLGTIKSLDYMRSEVARVAGVASDEPSFRAYDLNQALSPTREAVCTPADLEACFVDDAEYRGQAFVGIDIGEASSRAPRRSPTGLRAAPFALGWRSVTTPTLVDRSRRDGADYAAMERICGELRTYPGRVVPVSEFVSQVEVDLSGVDVRTAVADGYRSGELLDCCPWPLEIVRSGVGPSGSQAVRAFQRAVSDTHACDYAESFPDERDLGIDDPTRRERQSGARQGAVGWPDRRAECRGPGGRRGGVVPGRGSARLCRALRYSVLLLSVRIL